VVREHRFPQGTVSELLQPLGISIGAPNRTELIHQLRLLNSHADDISPFVSRALLFLGSSMFELFVAVIAFFSATIFLAHAVEAYLTSNPRGAWDRAPRHKLQT
jgi:hypothetical protein